MRKHKGTKKAQVHVYCNMCGKEMKVFGETLVEDLVQVTKEWGYFSEHDLEIHRFNICEACYDQLVSTFKIPVTVSRVKEVL